MDTIGASVFYKQFIMNKPLSIWRRRNSRQVSLFANVGHDCMAQYRPLQYVLWNMGLKNIWGMRYEGWSKGFFFIYASMCKKRVFFCFVPPNWTVFSNVNCDPSRKDLQRENPGSIHCPLNYPPPPYKSILYRKVRTSGLIYRGRSMNSPLYIFAFSML